MRELDDGFDARGARHHYAIAQGPTAAAARPRPGCAHERTPKDHQHVVRQHSPGGLAESPIGRCRGSLAAPVFDRLRHRFNVTGIQPAFRKLSGRTTFVHFTEPGPDRIHVADGFVALESLPKAALRYVE